MVKLALSKTTPQTVAGALLCVISTHGRCAMCARVRV